MTAAEMFTTRRNEKDLDERMSHEVLQSVDAGLLTLDNLCSFRKFDLEDGSTQSNILLQI